LHLSSRLAATVPALLLAATILAQLPANAEPASATADCADVADVTVLPSPVSPWKGAPLRVVLVSEKPLQGEFSLIGPGGAVAIRSRDRHGGPPYFWFAEVAQPAAGQWQARLTRDDAPAACPAITRNITVARNRPSAPDQRKDTVWPQHATWNRATENLYSAWIEMLFDAPLDASPSWKALHFVLRDRTRNFLFDHLGLREDQKGIVIRPDCADLPYFLRAYFAFKMGLPFGYAKCTRGGGGEPPRCPQWWNIEKEEPPPPPPDQQQAGPGAPKGAAGKQRAAQGRPQSAPPPQQSSSGSFFDLFKGTDTPPPPPPKPKGLAPAFGAYLETVADGVHSGAGRTEANDNETDYYPVPLSAESLRPGTVYADPYGHLLVLARRIAQTGDAAGVLLAVDGQPDGTVSRKRFWRGNFLFAQDRALGSPGFKRFRPVVRERSGGLRRLTNNEITKHPQYGDFSLDQSRLAVEAFYDRMEDVLSPSPLDPERALKEAIAALDEQVKARVTSVENGRKYQVGGGREVDMPDGAAIFETTGAWEDFATPSRDLRLLIAIDVVRGFPDRVARRPERYAMPEGKSPQDVKTGLDEVLATELKARKFSYTRSDGSPWTLTLDDVVHRIADLEMAYNLNDCVERRWGAPEAGEEVATCRRQASPSQRRKMAEYRAWFHERRRPPRG